MEDAYLSHPYFDVRANFELQSGSRESRAPIFLLLSNPSQIRARVDSLQVSYNREYDDRKGLLAMFGTHLWTELLWILLLLLPATDFQESLGSLDCTKPALN